MTSYLIKAILCSGILLLFYHLFLEKEKMHTFKRFYLLVSMLFAVLIPLLTIEVNSGPVQMAGPLFIPDTQLTHQVPVSTTEVTPKPEEPSPTPIPQYIYLLVVGLLSVRFLKNIISVVSRLTRHKTIRFHNARLVLIPDNTVTYTFLKYIFINTNDFEQNRIEKEILAHELAHVTQRHSLDILFAELFQIVFWFNPLVIFYKKAIQLNHEFLADEAVLIKYHNPQDYKLLLLDKVLSARPMNLTSSFNYSITKKRLAMMTHTVNRSRQALKQLSLTVFTLALIFVFSEKIYSQEKTSAPAKKGQPDKQSVNPSEKSGVVTRQRHSAPGPGVTAEEMKEFNTTIDKNFATGTTSKGYKYERINLSPEQKNRMFALYSRMNDNQRQSTPWRFFKAPIPVKSAPSEEVFQTFKDPLKYGVWLNGTKVKNSELNKYKSSDIAEWMSSKLYANARKGRIYKYQLDLTTNDHFDKHYQQRIKDLVLFSKWNDFAVGDKIKIIEHPKQ